MRLTPLETVRHYLARERNRLHDELGKLKVGSSIYKSVKGRIGGIMDAIEICDQELLAEEQGRAQCNHEWEYHPYQDARRCPKCNLMQANI